MSGRNIVSFGCALALAAIIMSCGLGGGKNIVFHVSPSGDDTASGKSEKAAFATIARARDAIRDLKSVGKLTRPVTVRIAPGTYELTEPLVFTPDDSGTDQTPVTYAASGGGAVISGGREITGWKNAGNGVWTAPVPQIDGTPLFFRQLFVNGERRIRARTPNDGWFTIKGKLSTDDPARLAFSPGDIKKEWADRGDVEIMSLHKWSIFRLYIRSVNEKASVATLSQKFHNWIIEDNARYRVENIPEALDSPGEWYLDAAMGTVSYIPLPGEDMMAVEVIAPALTELVRFAGEPEKGRLVRRFTLDGLSFMYTDWTLGPDGFIDSQAASAIPGVIRGDGMEDVTIRGCTIAHHGNYAIDISRGCKNILIEKNEIYDIGAGGVRIGETTNRDNVAEQTERVRVDGNHIHHIGEVYPEACGVIIFQSARNTIAHNHIHDTYYTGISNGWTWGYKETLVRENIIEFNHVHHIGRGMLSDMGGNYNLGVQPGTVVRNNLFHDIESSGYGGWGIYTDEGSTGILIENNIVYATKTGGFHQHYGRENIVRNNIFAFAREGQIIRSRGEEHLSFTFERNIMLWDVGPLLGGNWTLSGGYSDDGSLKTTATTPSRYLLDYNCYWRTDGVPVLFSNLTFDEWKARGQDAHSLIADPLFADPKNGDFTMNEKSPALTLGFVPISLEGVPALDAGKQP